jgi:hypothetical protein
VESYTFSFQLSEGPDNVTNWLSLPVSSCVCPDLPTDILNVEQLRVVQAPDKRKDVSQGPEGTDAVCLGVTLQKTRLTETKSSSLWILVAGTVHFVDAELRNRSDVLIATETVAYFFYPQQTFQNN